VIEPTAFYMDVLEVCVYAREREKRREREREKKEEEGIER